MHQCHPYITILFLKSFLSDINITGIASLGVYGVGMPLLDFDWFGLKLLVTDNRTVVNMQNVHFTRLVSYPDHHALRRKGGLARFLVRK